MKVLKCNETPIAPKPQLLSFEDIQKEEGVYKEFDNSSTNGTRLVVIRHSLVSVFPVVLYYNGKGNLAPAHTPSWNRERFVKTDERVHFEIK